MKIRKQHKDQLWITLESAISQNFSNIEVVNRAFRNRIMTKIKDVEINWFSYGKIIHDSMLEGDRYEI